MTWHLLRVFFSRHEDIFPGLEPEARQTLVLDLLGEHHGHGPAQLVVEEPQGFTGLDVGVESCTVGAFDLVALGRVPMVHFLDAVERLYFGEIVGVAGPRVHGVEGDVLVLARVLLEEESEVCEWRRVGGQLGEGEERLVVPPHQLPDVPGQPRLVPVVPDGRVESGSGRPTSVSGLEN